MNKQLRKSPQKKNSLLTVYYYLNQGLNPTQVAKKLKVPYSTISYYVTKLKKENYIEKLSYGVWRTTKKELRKSPNHTPNFLRKSIRGHAFQFKVNIPKLKNWKDRAEYLKKKEIDYEMVGGYKAIPRIVVSKCKVQLCNECLIIYFNKCMSFFERTAKASQKDATHKLLSILNKIEVILATNFKKQGKYTFEIKRQHYSLINCSLAKHYNKEKKLVQVRDRRGELWFLIDNSYNLNESETTHQRTAPRDQDKVITPFLNTLREQPNLLQEIVDEKEEIKQRIKGISETQMNMSMALEQVSNNLIKLARRLD